MTETAFLQYTGYVLAFFAVWIVARCARSMLSERYVPEVWGYLELPDGTSRAIEHWECILGRAKASDIVLTGEGKLDASSLFGKAPYAVMQSARALGLPCYAFCGALQEPLPLLPGLTRAYCIAPDVPEAVRIAHAASLLQACVHQWAKSF